MGFLEHGQVNFVKGLGLWDGTKQAIIDMYLQQCWLLISDLTASVQDINHWNVKITHLELQHHLPEINNLKVTVLRWTDQPSSVIQTVYENLYLNVKPCHHC